jgi:predicted SAM-dependent methyltransferase
VAEEVDYAELARTTGRRINVGSGDWPLSYFTNIDEDPSKPAQLHYHVPPLDFDDVSVDYVWAGHFLEHLPYDEGAKFLDEAFRVLAPGGKCGIMVPDTREIVTRWLRGDLDCVEYPQGTWWPINDLDSLCHLFFYSTAQDSPHLWSYDRETLARAMDRAGFTTLKEIDRYRGPFVIQGHWYQVVLEGTKPA